MPHPTITRALPKQMLRIFKVLNIEDFRKATKSNKLVITYSHQNVLQSNGDKSVKQKVSSTKSDFHRMNKISHQKRPKLAIPKPKPVKRRNTLHMHN